jgi:thermitase
MSQYGITAILILLLFGSATGEMPHKGKQPTPFNPQNDVPHNPGGCEKQGKRRQPQFVQGEVLVKFKAGITREGIDEIREAYGLSLIKRLQSIGVYRFKIPSGSTVEDIVDALNGNPQVEYAEPNYTVGITGK